MSTNMSRSKSQAVYSFLPHMWVASRGDGSSITAEISGWNYRRMDDVYQNFIEGEIKRQIRLFGNRGGDISSFGIDDHVHSYTIVEPAMNETAEDIVGVKSPLVFYCNSCHEVIQKRNADDIDHMKWKCPTCGSTLKQLQMVYACECGHAEAVKMYLYEDGKAKPNVNSEMVSMITEKTGISFSESLVESETEFDIMDLFDYSYGILNSPLYIEKYIDLLKIEFPKVPIPNGNEMFWRIVAYGRRLRKLHLLEEDIGNPMGISFEGVGDNIVSSRKLKPEGLYINRTQLFTNVTEEIWDFCYGGYHGLQKWFKDRNGMKLSEDDIQHVIRVLNVFEKTISIREDLDICMDEFGLI